jgi:hypothetical protein
MSIFMDLFYPNYCLRDGGRRSYRGDAKTDTVLPNYPRLGGIRERAWAIEDSRGALLDRDALPDSYVRGLPDDVIRETNLQFLMSLTTLQRLSKLRETEPGETPASELLSRVPGVLARTKHRGIAGGVGGAALLALASGPLRALPSCLPPLIRLAGICCAAVAAKALFNYQEVRCTADHLQSWDTRLRQLRVKELEAQIPQPAPQAPREQIEDASDTILVGDVRLPKRSHRT